MANDAGFTVHDAEPSTTSPNTPWPERIDEAAYLGLAGDAVKMIEPHTEADPVALLLHYLIFFGNATGRGPHYLVEADRHATNVNAVLVGRTAKGRKGTAAARIRAIFALADPEWTHDRVHTGMSSGEGLIWNVRDPILGRTKEGKGSEAQYVECVIDPGVSDKRLMILESEFAAALQVMQREGNTLSRIVRDGWDRGDLAMLTKNSPARATGALLSILGHSTVDELRRNLTEIEMSNGYANRFLYACVRRSRFLPHGGALGPHVITDIAAKTSDALKQARLLGRVQMDEAARAHWSHIYSELSEERPGLLGAVTARAEAQVIRLSLLYALVTGAIEIGTEHLKAALAVWEYCDASARYIFGDQLGDPVADELLRALRQAGPTGMTRTKIINLFSRHRSAGQIDRALSLLAGLGRAMKVVNTETGGRPSETWVATWRRG